MPLTNSPIRISCTTVAHFTGVQTNSLQLQDGIMQSCAYQALHGAYTKSQKAELSLAALNTTPTPYDIET